MPLNRISLSTSRLNRISWRDMFPKFPIVRTITADGEEIKEEENLLVKCQKGIKRKKGEGPGWNMIPLSVCMRSIFRFDPKSEACKKCFHLAKGQKFPDLFLFAKKQVHFAESIQVVEAKNKKKETEEESDEQ